jgi:hypothetical protein
MPVIGRPSTPRQRFLDGKSIQEALDALLERCAPSSLLSAPMFTHDRLVD